MISLWWVKGIEVCPCRIARIRLRLLKQFCLKQTYPQIISTHRYISQGQVCICFFRWKQRHVIFSVSCLSLCVFEFHSQSTLCFRPAVYLVQSEPKLTIYVSESTFVIRPAAIDEINGAIESLLEHCPAPTGRFLVAKHLKRTLAIGVDCVNSCDSLAGF